MMYFIISNGGLGNQMFQYFFVKSNLDGEIIFIGFEDISSIIKTNENFYFSNKSLTIKIIKKMINKIVRTLDYFKIFSFLKALRKDEIETTEIKLREGIFKNIIIVYDSFFQSEFHLKNNIIKKYKLHKNYKSNFKPTKDCVFLHIRRGDYLNYRVLGKSVILPDEYFKKCIEHVEKKIQNPTYYIFSDSSEDFKHLFHNKKYFNLSYFDYKETFLIMTKFQNAILSPSSFSWWATYFMKKKNLILVPKYWLGFNSKKYYPERPIASYMTEIDLI